LRAAPAALAFALLAFVLFPLQDAGLKALVTAAPVWQLMAVRSGLVVAVALVVGRGRIWRRIAASPQPGMLALRAAVMLIAWLCFYSAAGEMPLAQLSTLYFVAPVFVTMAAGPVLGERIGPRQWLAVALGFAGVVTASGVTSFDVSPFVALALLAALFWAAALIMLRRMAPEDGPVIQVVSSNALFLAATAPGFAAVPLALDGTALAFMTVIAVIGALGQLTVYEAARRMPASLIATLEYTSILWAFLFGRIFFGEVPGWNVLAGAALVVASGLLAVTGGRRAEAARTETRPPSPARAGEGGGWTIGSRLTPPWRRRASGPPR